VTKLTEERRTTLITIIVYYIGQYTVDHNFVAE